jgi:hypothetical protein
MIEELLGEGVYIGIEKSTVGFEEPHLKEIYRVVQDVGVRYKIEGITLDKLEGWEKVPIISRAVTLFSKEDDISTKYVSPEQFYGLLNKIATERYPNGYMFGDYSKLLKMGVDLDSIKIELKEPITILLNDNSRYKLREFRAEFLGKGSARYTQPQLK